MSEGERPKEVRRSARLAAREGRTPVCTPLMGRKKRRYVRGRDEQQGDGSSEQGNGYETRVGEDWAKNSELTVSPKERYYLARIFFLRFVGLLYFVAFSVALSQNRALLGEDGITPYAIRMESLLGSSQNDLLKAFWHSPSLLWFVKRSDENLLNLSRAGVLLSLVPMSLGKCNAVTLAALWVLYMSIVNVGGTFYGFGWETQLLEVGFWSITISPMLRLNKFPEFSTPPLVVWSMRWLLFRVMIGAGLIKIRGDSCWRDLTCMNFHYETQPLPNPISYFLHHLPSGWHAFETAANHTVELVAPLLLFCPRRMRIFGGLVQVGFQVALILSGNLSFLNWLTIAPTMMCFDDYFLLPLYRPWPFKKARKEIEGRLYRRYEYETGVKEKSKLADYFEPPVMLSMVLLFLLVGLSRNVVMNLGSSKQVMNTSFDSFKLVNTYGAFGSISKSRKEVVIEGTMWDAYSDKNAVWEEYEFKCKPGNVRRRPCVVSPFHYRLDWLMWFAAFGEVNRYPWLVSLMHKLLADPSKVADLLDDLPFEGQAPKAVRAVMYQYKFANGTQSPGVWWEREIVKEYCGALTLDNPSLLRFLEINGLVRPRSSEEEDANVATKKKAKRKARGRLGFGADGEF